MDAITANLDVGADGAGAWWAPPLALGTFVGTLDHLLNLARAQQIDLSQISLTALVEQLVTALRQAPATIPLGQKADWVVMAAWLVQLRTRLLLPTDAPAQQEAQEEVCQLRSRLVTLQAVQALAVWLERRPQLGQDVFARGRPEIFGLSVEAGQAVDVIEFLWASLALFDDGASEPDTATTYRPIQLDLYAVVDARDRILRRLAATPGEASLEQCLPPPDPPEAKTQPALRRRSAWSSTLVASLELARLGSVALRQVESFQTIHIAPV